MHMYAALRKAIADREADLPDTEAAARDLGRLYAAYAQAWLEAHGIHIDLPTLCDTAAHDRFREAAPSR